MLKKLLLTFVLTVSAAFGQTLDSEEANFLTLINAYRAQNGVAALQVSATLQTSSLWMSNDLGTHNIFDHTDSLGRDPRTRILSFGYPSTASVGENIAGGFVDAQTVFSGFQSACDPDTVGNCTFAHRLNMLSASFRAIGIGRVNVPGSTYGWYWTTDFGTVVDQTLPPPPPPPSGQLPTISFSASPSTINAGQSSNLSWNVSGASTITINASGAGTITVTPTQTTTYTLSATNAAGTATAQSFVTVASSPPPPPPPPSGACPAPTVGVFTGCYFTNINLTGNPALVRTDNPLNFTWGNTSPGVGIPPQNFSVRWQGIFNLTAINYNFVVITSDGFRFLIDGAPIRSAWRDIPTPSMFVIAQTLTPGNHLLTLEYYESTGNGRASLTW